MKIVWMPEAWEDYLYWQTKDKKILKKVNLLIKECQRTPFVGTGKPEALKNNLTGWLSRRINHSDRLVYKVENDTLFILQCRYHY
ncbi:Txe/YoeB family addiction module toxin [Plebeiibacterium marinum]|uniref:Putative mRNA interferase YoeB n=1 Tax=Plebeiibacterium marinum TaxID=2992111 RepID=A0AAE3MAJ1_9BACT|nr:Txe/YoeB family addiction module toxin [Plebeiobacterium marinum]MCW3804333.1 Txe/YoeB family addiction module toxin [Plebeiobacterium marinum]